MKSFLKLIGKFIPSALRTRLGTVRRKFLSRQSRIEKQKRRLLKNSSLTAEQAEAIRCADNRIHNRDGMFEGDSEHYFMVGLSALECIDDALKQAKPVKIQNILDLPSGHGRELRFIKNRFPEALIVACEIQREAVDFCVETFAAKGVYSHPELDKVSFDCKFDLIWCGSLITHLNKAKTLELLKLFVSFLNPRGVLIFTTHGEYIRQKMENGDLYELRKENISEIVAGYQTNGYGYHNYPKNLLYADSHAEDDDDYGISLTSPDWIRRLMADEVGESEEIYFKPQAWDNHQDVFGFQKIA